MADSKLDLPDDLLSPKPSDHSWAPPPKVEASGRSEMEKVPLVLNEDSKDQLENSIPLSPQWLYTKPSETKPDMRGPSSVFLGNSGDPSQKEAWRLDGSEDKKDWRRIASESEGSRRWREEERETGLLGGRRDRRKTDRRTESVSIRDTIENRVLASSDRWHDGSNRNSAHETRRDSKWSSRWGPEEKDKESRIEKRADAEKEKDDTQNENHPSTGSNRPTSERDSDSRDKWRPRHRMEIHSSGSSSYRAAPGFGLERGRTEGSKLGFALGRGRSNAIGRASSATISSAAHPYKNGSSIGKLNLPTDTFCYPRGKLLDIYRSHKLDPYFGIMPKKMDECPPIAQLGFVEPLAFVTPGTEEEAILTDIWKGKLTSSGVVYNASQKGRSTENISGVGEYEITEGKLGIAADTFHELADEEVPQTDSSWSHGSNTNALNEKEVDYRGGTENVNILTAKMLQTDGVYRAKEVATPQVDVVESWQMLESTFTECTEPGTSLDVKSKLPDDSSTLFVLTSSEHTQIDTHSHLGTDSELKDLDGVAAPEDLYFFYIDPSGNTQGPFLGADIILWFEEGYFGTELPVRLADAPEGTPFHNLGDVMPHLKLRGETSSEEVEKSVPSVKSDPSVPILESTNSSASTGLSQSFSDLNSLASQQPALSRISKPEASLKLPQTHCESFHDFVAQDEEIVFPGRPSSISYPNVKSAGNIHDFLATANTQTPLPNESVESGLPYQKDTKLHPFGLLWSELEGSHTRPSETSDVPVNVGRAVSYGALNALNDTASAVEKRTDVFRPETLSASDLIQDAFAACRLSRTEQEPNNFDLTEQLMSLQFPQQQQLQQRNMLSSYSRMNESFLENVPSQNPICHQQLANHTASDLEHLLALRRHQQQQLQLQQQHQLLQQQYFNQQKLLEEQQQSQQYFNQQKLLEEQQQSQVRYALFEQLMHAQIPDPGLPHSHIDPLRANSDLDQVLLEQQLLQEMHQRSHHPVRHFIPQVEQLAQSKFGLMPQREQQRDLFELLSRGHHGQVQSLDHKILQEQLHARQLSMALRQRRNVEEERRIDPAWPINENDNFLGNIASNHRAHTSGISPLDFFQQMQMQSHDDQLAQLQRTHLSQDRHQQELFEPGALPFDRSLPLPAGASGMNMDAVNAMVHAHGLNIHELNTHMQSCGQVVAFSTGIPSHSHQTMVPNQFHASNLEAIDGHWSESNGKVTNDWMESRFQQFNINSEQQKRESEVKVASEDQSSWMSDGSNDDKSRRLLMELLHQKSGHQSADLRQVNDGISFERRVPGGLYSGSSSLDQPFSSIPGQETTQNNSFSVGSYGSNMSEPADLSTADEQVNFIESKESFPFRSDSRVKSEGHSFVSGVGGTAQVVLTDSNVSNNLLIKDYLPVEGMRHGSKNLGLTNCSVSEIHDGIAEKVRLASTDHGELPVNAIRRQASHGIAGDNSGFYNDKVVQNSAAEDITINQVALKVRENILPRRPPVSRASSSQEGLVELVSETTSRGKTSLNSTDGGSPINQANDSKREVRFRRTSSCSDADVSEPSFIDMLKSNTKRTAAAEVYSAGLSELSDGAQGARSSKRKGKKGRQIDPALLGFKVTSNRIMMGEIQRVED